MQSYFYMRRRVQKTYGPSFEYTSFLFVCTGQKFRLTITLSSTRTLIIENNFYYRLW